MNMSFLLDENMPYALLEALEKQGFIAKHLKKIGQGGIKNGEVYKLAESDASWIVTRDADFKSYQKFLTYQVGGILVFSLSDTRTQNVLQVMKQFLEKHREKLSVKRLIIIEEREIRIYEAGKESTSHER